MKIILPGHANSVTRATCKSCSCLFEFEDREAITRQEFSVGATESTAILVQCPFCASMLSFSRVKNGD